MAAPTNGYVRLTRADLRNFDDRSKDLIIRAMEMGAVARITNKGHCIIKAPNGALVTVSGGLSKPNRSRNNTEAEFARAFPNISVALAREAPERMKQEVEEALVDRGEDPTLECPAKGCEAVFVTEGARYSHIEKQHYKCKEEGCNHVAPSPRSLAGHVSIIHRGNKPWEHAGAASKAAAEARRAVTPTPTPVAPRPVTPVDVAQRAQRAAADDKSAAVLAKRLTAQPTLPLEPVQGDPSEVLAKIRCLLGEDPRVQQLQMELDAARARIADLEAKLALVREATTL